MVKTRLADVWPITGTLPGQCLAGSSPLADDELVSQALALSWRARTARAILERIPDQYFIVNCYCYTRILNKRVGLGSWSRVRL